jgi:toxin-antitoxin system PIN domain toxin
VNAALLDVNVLIALVDPRHVHHELAHRWFAGSAPGAWATCPITENAVLRILGHPRYPNSPGPPAVVAPLLQGLLAHPRHRFWPDGLSLLAGTGIVHDRLLDSAQLTDTYLLALAVHNEGTLVTLDRRLRGEGVRGGAEALRVLQDLPHEQ